MRMLVSMLVTAYCFGAVIPQAHAQTSHAAPQSVLDAAVQDHVAATAADRQRILSLLERPEVQAVAGDFGLDLRRAKSAVATLEGQQLADVASHAQQVEQALAGGQSRVVISTTMIIIALLVLILVIVAVD